MLKSFLILIIFQTFVFAKNQIILVVSEDFNSSKAVLSCFEDDKKVFKEITVNIGKNGLGFGLGKIELKNENNYPLKYEGDKKAPLGVFKLTHIFGYKQKHKYKMPYLYTNEELKCVDDSESIFYNKIINMPQIKPKSFESMKRKDHQYEIGIVVEHNKKQIKHRGSCIFLHVEKFSGSGTAGCTSMSLENIKKIVSWLDESKNPILIQITKEQLPQIKKLYPNLN